MKQSRFHRIIGLLLVALLFLASAAGCTLGQGTRPGPAKPKSSATKPGPARQPSTKKAGRPAPARKRLTVLAFYAKDYKWTTAGLPSIEKHAGVMDIIAPFWYSVETDGSVTGKGEPDVIRAIQNKGKKLVIMVNNANTNDAMLKDPTVGQKAVANIAALLANNPYDGVNIDFQLVPPTDREGYTTFIKSLADAIRPKGKSLGVSVFPPTLPNDISGVYDYATVAKYVDYVAIMTYDRHQRSTPPGPVAPITWVEQNIQAVLKMIPREKLFIGIATYGYDWPTNPGAEVKDLGTKEIMALVDKYKVKVQWDNTEQEPTFTYTDESGMSHTVWFESAEAASKRIALADKYGLGGIAIWRLGFEDPRLWDFVK